MVTRKSVYILVAVVVVVVAAAVYWLVFSEENRVRQVINSGAGLVSKAAHEQPLVLAAKSNRLKPLLADELIVDIPAYHFQGKYHKNDVATRVLAAMTQAEIIEVQVFDLAVTISSDHQAAAVLTAEVSRKLTGHEKETDYLQLACGLEKKAGDWLINHIEVIETLEK